MEEWFKRVWLIVLLIFFIPCGVSAGLLKSVRFWTAPDHTRVVLDVTAKGVSNIFWLKEPCRLVIDIQGITAHKAGRIKVEDGVIKVIRWAPRERGKVRVVLELYEKLAFSFFYLKPFQGLGARYVIDVLKPPQVVRKEKEAREIEAARVKKEKKFVVVIDPGHGGDDPGAIHNGIREKEVVLRIAKKLQAMLNATPGYRAYLTRVGDYYVSLRKRVEIAQDYRADLFISIHCNAAPNRRARGVMVFSLSSKGATDSVARMLAKIENTADMMEVEFSKKREINYILLDLAQDYSATESIKFAKIALRNLVRETGLPNGGVKRAGFTVLKNPGIPSVLVEVGFLTNRREARLIRSEAFRIRVARALSKSVIDYFRNKNKLIVPSTLAEKKTPRRRWIIHVVRKGETLWGISKRYGIKVRQIMAYNGLKRDKIVPGQKLKLPVRSSMASSL